MHTEFNHRAFVLMGVSFGEDGAAGFRCAYNGSGLFLSPGRTESQEAQTLGHWGAKRTKS